MGVYKIQSSIKIEGATPDETTIAYLQYLVGFALTRWHFVEQDLTMIYLTLSCPTGAPIDSALATFTNIQTVDAKLNVLRKVVDQVLFQDEFADFRKRAKKGLNRVGTLNDQRNKIAHGMAKMLEDDAGIEKPYFLPFYNIPGHYRERALTSRKMHTGIIKRQEKWDFLQLVNVVESLREGPEISHELLTDLGALYRTQKATLLKAGRMTLDHGLPCDLTQTSDDLPRVSLSINFQL